MALTFDFSELEQKLLEISKKTGKEFTDLALKEGGEILLQEQLQEVPRDTNDLANSLIVGKISGTKGKKKILVGINPTKYDEVRYGFYQEHGTDIMLGKRWMKTAWKSSAKKASQRIGEVLAEKFGGV